MKRKLSIIGVTVIVAACAFGAPRETKFTVNTTTNDTGSATNSIISGYIDEIVAVGSGTYTGTFAVVATQPLGNTVTLAGKSSITAATRTRPRFDGTIADGTANTSDPPERYLSYGDNIVVTWTSCAPTGQTWSVWIKWDDGK